MIKLDDDELEAAEAAGLPMIKAPSVEEAVLTVVSMMGFNRNLLNEEQTQGLLWLVGREVGSSLRC